jgi:hypothetical protein
VNSPTSPRRWSSTRHSWRADWKPPNTWPAPCMISTSSQCTTNSGRERSGVYRMFSPPPSKNSSPSRSSGRQPDWEGPWRLGFRSRSNNAMAPLAEARPSSVATIENTSTDPQWFESFSAAGRPLDRIVQSCGRLAGSAGNLGTRQSSRIQRRSARRR